MNNKQRLAKNTLILSFCTIINKGLMFIMVPIFTRWLSVEDYGSYDLFVTYVSLLIPIITLSSSNAIFRLSIDANEDLKKSYIANGFYMISINMVISVAILLTLNFYHAISHFWPFLLMLVLEVLDNYFQGYLRALKKLSFYGFCKSATTFFSAVMICVFVRCIHLGLDGLILGYCSGYFLSILLVVFLTKFWRQLSGVQLSTARFKELVSYSWPLIPNDLSWWVISVSDRQIINMFIGTAANGIYAVAYKVPNLCTAVFGVFNISWQESATENMNDSDRLNFYNSVLNSMISLLLSICIGIISCNFILFDFVFDVRYSTARLYTAILIASVIFSTIALFYGGIQISLKRPKANGYSTIIGAIINAAINLLFVQFIGLYAAAISTLVSNMVVLYIRKYLLRNDYKFTIEKKQYIYALLFIYFAVLSTLKLPLFINILNLAFASILFVVINKTVMAHTTWKVINEISKKG